MIDGISNIEYTPEEYLNCASDYKVIKNNNENCEGEVTLSIIINDEKIQILLMKWRMWSVA